MTSIVYQQRIINGKLYPRRARTDGEFGYAFEEWREGDQVRNRYLGIMEIPNGHKVIEKLGCIERKVRGAPKQNVIEKTKSVIEISENNGHFEGFKKLPVFMCECCGAYLFEEDIETHRSVCETRDVLAV